MPAFREPFFLDRYTVLMYISIDFHIIIEFTDALRVITNKYIIIFIKRATEERSGLKHLLIHVNFGECIDQETNKSILARGFA